MKRKFYVQWDCKKTVKSDIFELKFCYFVLIRGRILYLVSPSFHLASLGLHLGFTLYRIPPLMRTKKQISLSKNQISLVFFHSCDCLRVKFCFFVLMRGEILYRVKPVETERSEVKRGRNEV